MSSDESDLIARCRAGDLAAFEPLVEKYRQRVWRLAYRVLGDREEARDVAQEAFVRAYQSLGEFRGQSAFYTWLFRIVVNLATDRRRQHTARLRAFGGEPVAGQGWTRTAPDPGSPPDLEARRAQERERIARALDALPAHHRTIIILCDIEGLSYREIADALGCPIGTVMSRLHNARKRLRSLLTPLLGLLLALWFGLGAAPTWAQAPSVSLSARILWASNAPAAPLPPGGQAFVPGGRAQDEAFRRHVSRLRQVFGYQSYEQLDLIQAQIPLGLARRFALPGGRELELRPSAVKGSVVRMDIKILNRGASEVSIVADVPPNRPALVGGPPYEGGVLIIAITAQSQP
ncbi:MAG: sigma-70 family RNA polymerase sigma factor [Candidatus Rokubacteria bacterium]|nr:sigma-70 family RNA polymerase sigma factor [Candidatus Rokubacteria bacterium]